MHYYPYMYPYPSYVNQPMYNRQWCCALAGMAPHNMSCRPSHGASHGASDYGKQPYVVNIDQAAKQNNTFRTAIWTGEHLQVTLMSIPVGSDVGLEMHPDVDQFLRIEQGRAFVEMGDSKVNLTYRQHVYDDFAILVPAGMWHNITNTGYEPLKLYSIYAPPEHPYGTVHRTQAEALAAEEGY